MKSKTSATRRPIGIDLFAGAGGLSLGFEQAGFDVVAAVEIDPIHCATHAFNFPNCATICSSVVDVTGQEIRDRIGELGREIDVVFGGAPCQGFSLIGKRAFDDPRNHLVMHFVRLVAELQPKYFVFENVKGLTLGKQVGFLDELIATLNEKGYSVLSPYKVLNALEYGVPQSRERLFVVGARRDQKVPEYPTPTVTRTSVWNAIGDLPNADQFDDLLSLDSVRVSWTSQSNYALRMRSIERDPTDYSYPRRTETNMLTSSMRTHHSELSQKRFAETPQGLTEPVSRFRKLPPDGFCNTLRAGTDSARGAFTSPRPIHPFLPRVITVREAARLHSFPDWFRLHITKWHGFRQIGNSVPPMLGRAVASEIVRALGVAPQAVEKAINLGDMSMLGLTMAEAAHHFRVPRNRIAQRIRKSVSNSDQQNLWSESHA